MTRHVNRPRLIHSALVVSLSMALGISLPGAAASSYDGVVVFGGSLSDPGNAFVGVRTNSTPPTYDADWLVIPSAPYARGGHHLTNGATWIEQFARSIGLGRSAEPAFRSNSPWATNYAVGAARAYDDGVNFNLSRQVSAFLADADGEASAAALYVVELGGNDVRDALVASAGGGNGAVILAAAIQSIVQQVIRLHGAGARHFLILNAPDIGLTPAVRALDAVTPGTAMLASAVTQVFNDGLAGALAVLPPLPGLQILRLDAYGLIHDIVADPASYGMVDVTSPCLTPGAAPFTCQTPDAFLFWDGLHPTRAAHAILAGEARLVTGQ